MLPDFDRADRIGEFWSYPESRTFARTSDRLRGGPGAPGGARRDAAGVGLLSRAAIEDPPPNGERRCRTHIRRAGPTMNRPF